MATPPRLSLSGVPGIPLIAPGDDLGAIIVAAMDRAGLVCVDGDIVVVAQKVVSKAQGRFVDLATVTPSARALKIAADTDRDARLVEVILSESVNILRSDKRALVVEHRDGFIMANAGVDRSNVRPGDGGTVLLLPLDPDGAAAALRATLEAHFGKTLGVVINDSFGRPWRRGTTGVALGAAGMPALNDLRGQPDLFGRVLEVSEVAFADEIAAAASLVMGQADEACPVVLLSGLPVQTQNFPARTLLRPRADDLFR